MAKYVCDFDEVESLCTKLNSLANSLNSEISSNNTELNSKLSEWSGSSKDAFVSSKDTVYTGLQNDVSNILLLSDLVKASAKSIEEVETQLAAIKI